MVSDHQNQRKYNDERIAWRESQGSNYRETMKDGRRVGEWFGFRSPHQSTWDTSGPYKASGALLAGRRPLFGGQPVVSGTVLGNQTL